MFFAYYNCNKKQLAETLVNFSSGYTHATQLKNLLAMSANCIFSTTKTQEARVSREKLTAYARRLRRSKPKLPSTPSKREEASGTAV
jgi:hypothetical protein